LKGFFFFSLERVIFSFLEMGFFSFWVENLFSCNKDKQIFASYPILYPNQLSI
jgi:hypothetical protein